MCNQVKSLNGCDQGDENIAIQADPLYTTVNFIQNKENKLTEGKHCSKNAASASTNQSYFY